MLSFLKWLTESHDYGETHVFVPGKMRIPTPGHKGLIDKGKSVAKEAGAKMTIGLSGKAQPLSIDQKKSMAQKLFDHPVETGSHVNGIVPALQHFHKHGVKHLHIVAGSDRHEEYQKLVDRYNGKPDKKGNVPFHFDKVTIHKHGEDREEGEVNKHPTEMTDDERAKTVSASRIEKLANAGDHAGVAAYYKGHDVDTKQLVKDIQSGSKK